MKTQLRHLVILLAFAGCLWRFGANNLTAQTLISGSITSTFNLSNSSYKLTGNVTLGSSAYFNVTGNNVTLDLNGYYIKGSGAIQDALCLIRVNKNNTLTIKDSRPNSGPTTGTVTTNDIWNIGSSPNDYGIKGGIICNARARAIVVENGGKLYIQGGTLAGNLTKDGGSGGAVYLSQNATCVMT